MPWQVPITVDGLEYPVTFNTEEQPTQQDLDEAVQQILSQRGQALQPAQPANETPGYLSQLGSALGLGYRQMKSGVGATFNALTGDTEDVAAEMAEQAKLQREQQAAQTPQDIEFMRRLDEAEKAYELARGPVETISALSQYPAAAFAEPGAALKTAVQSAPNVLISGATSLAGYGLGGLVGGAAGIETGPGAILTGIAGAAAGGALSNTLMEAGPSIFDALNEKTNGAAANMTAEQISAFLKANPDVIEQGLKTGAIRGSVIGAVEALGVKGSGRLLTMPERAAARAAQKTLVDAGVDVTSKKAVDAALLDPTIRSATKTAAEAAKNQFSSAGNLARMAGASAIETGAAGAGELAAQAAAGQDISTKEAFMEMLGEAALSAPMAAATKAVEGAKYALTPSQEAEQPEATQAEPTVVSTAEEPPSMLPFTREDIRATQLPFGREDIRATQLPFGREDIRATELPFSRQNIRGLSMIQPEIAIAKNAIAATQNVPFTDITDQAATNIVQENARIASQFAVQPEQATEEVGAEVTPLSEGAERNRAIIAEAAAKLRGEAPQDISAGLQAAIPQQPVETQEDAVQEQSTGGLLQYPQEEAGEAGSGREQVEQSLEGQETPEARQAQEEVITPPGEPTPATEGMVTPGGVAPPLRISIPEGATSSRTDNVKYQVAGLPDEVVDPFLAHGTDSADAVEALVKSGPRKDTEHYEGRLVPKDDGSPWGNTKTSASFVIISKPGQTTSSPNEIGAVVINRTSRDDKKTASMIAGMERRLDGTGVAVLTPEELPNWLRRTVSQTTAAEKQTPVPLRGGTGAAGVASSSLGGGRSPELTQVSTETETTSSEKLDPKLIEAERKQTKEEEAAVKQQEKLDQATKSSLNSVVGPQKKDPVVGTVTKADVETAREALTNSGEIPNAYLTNVYESREAFLADKANARLFPASYARLQTERNIEGLYENGQTLIFAKQIQVSDLDRNLAKMLGVSDEQAAARRVIAHENGHRAISLFTMAEKRELRGYLMRAYSEEQIAKLVERYTEYADWRTNPESRLEALEELLMRDFERMEKIPTGGVWDDIVQFLKRVWRRLTGQNGEPKLKELKDVVRLMRNALKRPTVPLGSYTLKDGGQVKLSYAGEKAIENLPEERRQFMRDSLDAAKAMAAAGKDSEEIRAATGWFPGKYDGKMRWEVPDEGARLKSNLEDARTVGDALDHTELFSVYPQARGIKFELLKESDTFAGSFDPLENKIKLHPLHLNKLGTLIHEVQHWIQREEGFPVGSSPKQFTSSVGEIGQENLYLLYRDFNRLARSDYDSEQEFLDDQKKLEKRIKNATKILKAKTTSNAARLTAGEIEARDVQARQKLTPEQRAATAPYSSENIAPEDAIVLFGSGPQASVQFSSETSAAFTAGSEAARSTLYSERDMDIREAIRRAYEAMPKTNSVAVPIGELFAKTEELMPGVTQAEFSLVLQDLFEDNGAVLQEGESDFFVTTPEGRRAGFVVVMPSKSISVPLALRSMAMSGPSGQPINQQKYDEALATISDFLTGKQTVQFPGKLTPSSNAGAGFIADDSRITQGIGEASRTARSGAGAGITRGQPSDAQAQGTAQQGFGPYSVRNLVGEASRIGVADVRIDPESQYGAYTVVSESGEIYIVINPARMANRIAANDGDVQYAIGSILNEELIHAADMAILRDQWLNSGSKLTLTEFVKEQDVKTVREMIQVAKSSNDPLEATRILFDAITSSINLYAGNDVTSLDSVEAFLNAASHDEISSVMGEFVRQMIQTGMYQTVSEKALFRKFIEKVKVLARKIADVFAPAKEGRYGNLIQERLNGIEELLTYASMNTGAKASKIPIEDAVDVSKSFKSDLAEAGRGRVDTKAKFKGKLLKETEIPEHNVKSYPLYRNGAIKLIDDLMAKTNDILAVAESLQDPEFQMAVGLQVSNDVSSEMITIARSQIGFDIGRRLTDAIKNEKNPRRKRELELAKKKGIIYYNAGTGAGQALQNRQESMDDPLYKGQIIFDQAELQKDKKAKEKLDAITGGTEKITDIITGAEQKAAEETTQAEVEAQESAAEDDEYAKLVSEGEAELTNEEKGLWERAKMLLRRFAMYAKRKGARAANAAKASLSAEQRKELDELNAIMQMSDEEAAKAESKDRAEFAAVLKKLLGEEKPNDTPQQKKTRQKRVKMIDVVRRYVESGKPIDLSDQQTALKGMLREMNKARPADSVPLERAMPWRKILSSKPKDVAEYRQRILEAVSSIESFQNLTEEQKERLADLYAEAWEERRQAILDRMLRDEIKKARDRDEISDDVEKKLQQSRNKILEIVNLGGFNNDDLVKILGERYGISTSFTEEQKARIQKLADQLRDEDINTAKRNKLAMQFAIELAGAMDVSIIEIIANWWTSSVLFGPQTIFSIGAAFLNGGYSIATIGIRRSLARLTKGDVQGALEESILMLKGFSRYLGAFKQAGRRAWGYLWTGDVGLLGIGSNDILSEISNFEQLQKFQRHKLLAEQLAKDPKMARRYVGMYLRFVSRLLTALDAFNVMVTKAATASLALRMSGMSTENIIKAEKMLNLKAYKDQVIRDYFDNKAPRTPYEKGLVDSYAEAEMYRAIDKMGGKMENADYLASESAMTMHPTGFGGVIYDAITGFFAQRQANADEYLEKMKKDWVTRKDLTSVTFLALAYLRQFAAYNAAGLTGSKFVRYASNKFNQGLSFIPFAGLLRQLEAKDDRIKGKDAFIETIYRNQVIGALMLFIGGAVLGAIEDEPDDEERGTFWNGGWANLTPDQKKQLLAKGQKEYTMGFKYNGRWYVFNYQNWPLNQVLSAIGSMSDQIRFSPKQWNEKNLLSKTVAGMVSGVKSTLEIPALSGLQELVGNRLASKDPTEQSLDRISRVASGWVGGFVPRILKDIDFATQPELRKYETLWEKTASHIPIYRRYVGEEYYDILGKPIKRNVIPGSREFMMGPTEPEYKILGALNSRNIFLTPANAEYRMVGKGRNRRRLTQEEADAYSLETGKGYRQMLLRYGQRALQMPTERARAFLSDKADEVRDRALKKVYRGYTK